MKTLKLLSLLVLALLFSHCGTTEPSMNTSTRSILEVHTVLDSVQNVFLASAQQTSGKVDAALRLTVDWLLKQSNVSDAYTLDDNYITIILKSGLKTEFYIDETDDAGNSIFRGGSGSNDSYSVPLSNIRAHTSPLSENTIKSKKVLLFAADTKSLPGVATQIPKTLSRLTNSGLGLEITVLKDEQCSYGVVEHFGDYGLVIIDTHGSKEGFRVGTTLDFSTVRTEADATGQVSSQAGAGAVDKMKDGKLQLTAKIHVNIKKPLWYESVIPRENRGLTFSSDYLDLLPKMSSTVIFGNMCYSGWVARSATIPERYDTLNSGEVRKRSARTVTVNNPIGYAFNNRDPISYYGYTRLDPVGTSRVVYDNFAAEMEDSLVKRLVESRDSTKIIHLKPDNVSEYHDYPAVSPYDNKNMDLVLRHYGKDDYSYVKCGDTLIDSRDGQKYPTVCIGTQNWMAKNLNYNAPGSITYNNDPANGAIYGRLYSFQTMMQGAAPTTENPSKVQGVCPKGWHVPSDEEFSDLFGSLGNQSGGELKSTSTLWNSPNLGATNSSGFSALPGGFSSDISKPDYFINLGYSAIFGTTTITDNIWQGWGILADSYTLDGFGEDPQKSGVSCRCVKD